ncbi:hypothetical protein G6F59_014385 [Rhizopus arrhizus]|nr:hypothetical protein G6F59_014385 [Rhizopus arrhizus]
MSAFRPSRGCSGRSGQRQPFTALHHQFVVPVQCTGLAEPARAECLPTFGTAACGEARAVAAVVQQVQIPLARRLTARRRGVRPPQVGTVFAPIIEGTGSILHRPQHHQVQHAEAAFPACTCAVEGQADVRPIAYRQQPRTAVAGLLPPQLQVKATVLPAPVRLLHVQRAAIGTAGAAGLATLGVHTQLQLRLPGVFHIGGRGQRTQQAVAILCASDAEAGRIVVQATHA